MATREGVRPGAFGARTIRCTEQGFSPAWQAMVPGGSLQRRRPHDNTTVERMNGSSEMNTRTTDSSEPQVGSAGGTDTGNEASIGDGARIGGEVSTLSGTCKHARSSGDKGRGADTGAGVDLGVAGAESAVGGRAPTEEVPEPTGDVAGRRPSARPSTSSETQTADARYYATIPSPLGVLRIVVARGVLVGVYHHEHDPEPAPALLGSYCPPGPAGEADHTAADQAGALSELGSSGGAGGPGHGVTGASDPTLPRPGSEQAGQRNSSVLHQVCRELAEYFDGRRHSFDVPFSAEGTTFQRAVWDVLGQIPFGEVRRYGEVATALGNPSMGRAIGAAVRANPLSIIIPGHRVVGSKGAVTGYAAGVHAKAALLEHERMQGTAIMPGDGCVGG